MPRRLDARDAGFDAAFAAFLDEKRGAEDAADVETVAAGILADVRRRGDAAVIEHTARLDRLELTPETMRFAPEELAAAESACDPSALEALRLAAHRIAAFHEQQVPQDFEYVDELGIRLGLRWTPIEAAGLYVPGGLASYPSSVLMNAVPAKVAGVERLVMVVPTPDGQVNPLVLAAARMAGVDEVYRIGGAQAIGALAHGTKTIRPVDKIVGPGNAWVTAAKRQVFGIVGIDLIAGPSEILVVADGGNDPGWVAADLLSQAEHSPDAQSILITDDPRFADDVAEAVEAFLRTLPRESVARESWERFGAIILIPHIDDAPTYVDRIAPEHLELAVPDPDRLARFIRHAGAIFLGRHTPEAIGDYVGGPNHVLPTSRSARFSSGLGVLDFMKRSTLLGCDADGLRALGPAAVRLARAEGLDAHALSVSVRLNLPPES